MRYSLDKFPSIPLSARQKLNSVEIYDTDQLLGRALLPADRQRLAEQTGLGLDQVARWAGIADLVRVKGIGPQTAEMLVHVGIAGNVGGFLAALHVYDAQPGQANPGRAADPQAVREAASAVVDKLKSSFDTKDNPVYIPSVHQLIEAAEEALELKPRLVLQEQDNHLEFRREVFATARDERRFLWKSDFWGVLVFAGVIAALSYLLTFLRYLTLATKGYNSPMDTRFKEFIHFTNRYLLIDILVFCITFLFLTGLSYLAWRLYSRLVNTHVKLHLFNSRVYQDTYRSLRPDANTEKKAARVALLLFVLFAAYLILVMTNRLISSTSMIEDIRFIIQRVFVFGILAAIIISLPTFLKLVSFRNKAVNQTAVQRYIAYTIIYMIGLPLIVLFLTQWVLPQTIQIHNRFVQEQLLPRMSVYVAETREYIENYPAEDTGIQWLQTDYLEEVDRWSAQNAGELMMLNTFGEDFFTVTLMPLARQALLGLFAVTITMLFILPYLIYGGIGKGIFYILLLAISLRLDNFLQAASPVWFDMQADPLISTLIIGVCLLSSALFFDWLYDFITIQPAFCPGCGQELSQQDRYCRFCGLVQAHLPAERGGLFKLLKTGALRQR